MTKKRKTNHVLPLKSIMTTEVVFVNPDTSIFDAIRLLPKYEVSGLPVVDQAMNIVGILTEKDVLKILTKDKMKYEDTVSQYMTKKVISFKEDDSAVTVCRFFQRNPIRRVPIAKDGKLVGIVSRRDIINLILEAKSNFATYRY